MCFPPYSKVTGIGQRAESELDKAASLITQTFAGANATDAGLQSVAKRHATYILLVRCKALWFLTTEKQTLGMGWNQILFSSFSWYESKPCFLCMLQFLPVFYFFFPSSLLITTISSQKDIRMAVSKVEIFVGHHDMDREEYCAGGQTNTFAIHWQKDTLDCHQDARRACFKN